MDSAARVRFERPDLDQITSNHAVVDLHFHSTYSDGLNRIDKIAARARKMGIGLAITDHNAIGGALEIDQYQDVFTIPGIEITAAEGSHLLVYFYDTRTLRQFYEKEVVPYMGAGVMSSLSLPMIDIVKRTRPYRCLTIFPHPYCAMYTGICNPQFSDGELHHLLHMVDGIEAINANNLNKWNLKCAVLGFNLGSAMVAGSDGHSLGHMGRAVSYARCAKTRNDFLEAVRHHKNHVIGKEVDLLSKVTANSLKLRSSVGNCQDLLEKNFRYSRKVINMKSRAIRSNFQRRLHARFNQRPVSDDWGL